MPRPNFETTKSEYKFLEIQGKQKENTNLGYKKRECKSDEYKFWEYKQRKNGE